MILSCNIFFLRFLYYDCQTNWMILLFIFTSNFQNLLFSSLLHFKHLNLVFFILLVTVIFKISITHNFAKTAIAYFPI